MHTPNRRACEFAIILGETKQALNTYTTRKSEYKQLAERFVLQEHGPTFNFVVPYTAPFF